MDAFNHQPAPLFSSTVDVPPLHATTAAAETSRRGNALPSAPAVAAASSAPGAAVSPPAPLSRPPDAFAVQDSSADPLLAGLHLARERLAYHLDQSTTNAGSGLYHGAAVTSLVVPVSPPPPPPLRRDAVDAAEAGTAKARDADEPQQQQQHNEHRHERHRHHRRHASKRHGAKDDEGHEKRRRHRSRRQREHDERIEMALNSAFVVEMQERPFVVAAIDSSSSSSSSSGSSSTRSKSPAAREAESAHTKQHQQNKKKKRGTSAQRRRRLRSQQNEAHREPSIANLDAHLRNLPPSGNDAAHESSDHQVDGQEYRPDDANATALLEERMQLLYKDSMDGAAATLALRGYEALVRPAEHFQSAPIPSWVRHYSDTLLFDTHRLDRSDAAVLAATQRDAHVQLPIDAVVLRLRGDVARLRRLRHALLQSPGLMHRILFPSTDVSRDEVYRPAEPDWAPAPPPQRRGSSAVGEDVEMRAAVPSKLTEQGNAAPEAPGTVEVQQEASTVVVVGSSAEEEDHIEGAVAPPQHTPPLLDRSLEARDLLRPVLTQTIPPWRRHGAAVKFVSEMIDLLEGRLRAIGKLLDDPDHGAALELVGAPDSSGVDGSVRRTCPPALERALRTTITNTLMSDLFATSRTALESRALRVSEALRRRQTPYVHDVYVTDVDSRPLYDYAALHTSRSAVSRYAPTPFSAGAADGHARGGFASVVDGGDARRSYSIHVDYVRFQPSLESAAIAALRSGHFVAPNAALSTTTAAASANGSHTQAGHTAAASSRRSTLLASSSGDAFSSLLLGSYVSVFFPSEKAGGTQSTVDPASSRAPTHAQGSHESSGLGSLGTEDVAGTTAALLLALSTATSANTLVAFSPESYLVSLLLRYYEQYRLLQLNLLPSLKNRFFYQEQLAQLQRQTRRTTELSRLQARLEQLAETSANVERGCLHVMILLWSAVLEERRRRRRRQSAVLANSMDAVHGASMASPELGVEEEADDPPIVVGSRSSHQRSSRHGGDQRRHRRGSSNNDAAAATPPPQTHEERRAHPPVFAAETSISSTPFPVVHAVDTAVTDVDVAAAAQRRKVKGGSASSDSSDHLSNSPPLPLFLSPNTPTARATSASASPLLAPVFNVSSKGSNTSSGSGNGGGVYSGAADVGGSPPTTAKPPPTRFRFFLRRYGTVEETPYRMGDDLLQYAAEVEGTDLVAPTEAADAPPLPSQPDELPYFQLVVFTRAHAAMVPQYVGCTTPRPMTTTKVIFFNETFEVRALHEPAELLLHLIPVTAGPSKMTVVSTVRLRPTLTRRYSLLPLQPPTAFMFHGKLFTRNRNSSGREGHSTAVVAAAAAAATSSFGASALSGVLAVSTTWTSSQGLTVAQMERIFLRGAGGGADPLDPQYLPLLRALRSYYLEVESTRAASRATAASEQERQRSRSRGRRDRRGAAVNSTRTTIAASTHHHGPRGGSVPQLGRHASSVAALRQRNASASLQRQLTTLGPSAVFNAAAATRTSVGGNVDGDVAAAAHQNAPRRQPAVGTTAAVALGAAVDHAVEELFLRLPTTRLQCLLRRWLIKVGRLKPADEVESRLLSRPIPLHEADNYLARKRVARLVEAEEAEQNREYGADGAQFDAERYYKAPSAISGLALSNLPRETKLKLWQERQRRLLLTLKANRHISDAEKLEAVVKVPKLVLKLVFDFAPRSQLNPHRQVRPKTGDIDRALLKRRQDSRIVIHIMKAHNLPGRADGTPLEPFVQASFVAEAAYTRSEVGSSPSWFQTLELPFQPLDFEEDTLGMIDDDVVVTVYDKVEVQMTAAAAGTTTAAVAHETHYRTERRFLGALRIPFYSLHQAQEARMEGVYPLRTPRWLLGYDLLHAAEDGGEQAHLYSAAPPAPFSVTAAGGDEGDEGGVGGVSRENPFGVGDAAADRGQSEATATAAAAAAAAAQPVVQEHLTSEPTVQLYLSLWPPLQRDPPKKPSNVELQRSVSELFVSPELHYLHRIALKWRNAALRQVKAIAAMNAQATTRQIDPFVPCSTGDLVLVCRYMLPRGGPPPPSVRTPYEAVRYVSLLPFVADMMSFGEKDVWSTNAELLAMRSGDYEELALLLVHFLRYLAPGRPTYAVVGSGSIYQQTIMVLHTFEDGELYLIDPRSGWTVPASKPYGTLLRDVSMVVSHDQMWANTQMSGLPHRMTWDLHNPAHWLPCFDAARDRRIPACLSHLLPIQREVLDFPAADAVKSREIEVELRACVRRALLTWRNGCPPAYHRGVEAILHDLLEAAEEERCTVGSARRSDITSSAAARLSEYFGASVTGSPMPWQPDALESGGTGHRHGRGKLRGGRRQRSEQREGGRLSSSSAIRVLGQPVMGSYNPADPHFEELLQQVYEGAVHEVGTNEVSFAAGIYVKSYTGDVCAMWVFLVAICRG